MALTVADIKVYFPPDLLSALTDDNEDNLTDDTVVQKYVTDSASFIASVSSVAAADANLLRILSAKYVIAHLYYRYGMKDLGDSAWAQFLDSLKRAAGTNSQADVVSTEILIEGGEQVFDDDVFEVW
jgi:hypothetical protein